MSETGFAKLLRAIWAREKQLPRWAWAGRWLRWARFPEPWIIAAILIATWYFGATAIMRLR